MRGSAAPCTGCRARVSLVTGNPCSSWRGRAEPALREFPHIVVYVTLRDGKEMKGRGREHGEGARCEEGEEWGGEGGESGRAPSSSVNRSSGHIKM